MTDKFFSLAFVALLGASALAKASFAEDSAVKLEAKASIEKPKWQSLRAQLRATRNFKLGAPFNFKVIGDGKSLYYLKATPPSSAAAIYELSLEDGSMGVEKKVLDAGMLETKAGEISAEEKALRERLRLMTSGISFYSTDESGRYLLVPLSGKLYVYDTRTKTSHAIGEGEGGIFNPRLSPDGKSVAFIRKSDLHVASLSGGKTRALTSGGTEERSFGVAEFIAQEELDRTDGFWWSPDSRTLLYEEVDQSKVERLAIADPFKPDAEPNRPFYPRPGKANAKTRFGFISASGGDTTWVDLSAFPHEYVSTVKWTANGVPTFLLMNRLQNEVSLVAADPKTGKASLLLKERDEAWVEVMASSPAWLPNRKGFLWLSDSSGSRQLQYHSYNGEKLKDLPLDRLQVRSIFGISEDGNKAFVEVARDSTRSELHEVDLVGGKDRVLGALPSGTVTAGSEYAKGLYVAREATLDGQDKTLVRSLDGKKEQLIPSAAEKPVINANVSIERIGADAVQTAIIRPSNFVRGKTYPVLERAYGGPGALLVRAQGRSYLEDQVMADAMQAIIVRMDTRGTPDRGREWEKAISRRFGSLPVDEHAEVIKQLVKKFPEMDASRVGVFGWSYGGYFAAYAALARPDVYKAAVAGAPPVDWLDYDTAYTERYLGLPTSDAKAYESSSLLSLIPAAAARGSRSKIMLIHGTADDNVFFFNSLKLVDALERAALPYEFLPLMGATHIVSDEALDARRFERTLEFFRANLPQSAQRPRAGT
jgi:dipeptidyl-peptidase-4